MTSHFTLTSPTKLLAVRGRPNLKYVERFGNGSIHELNERTIYERTIESEPFVVINRAIDTKYCELSTLTDNELCLDKGSDKKSIMICTGNIVLCVFCFQSILFYGKFIYKNACCSW